jgi:hypothetical protein
MIKLLRLVKDLFDFNKPTTRIIFQAGRMMVKEIKFKEKILGVQYEITDGLHGFTTSDKPLLSPSFLRHQLQEYMQERTDSLENE